MQSEKNQDRLDYKTLLANAKQALKVEYQKSAALASQLKAIKTQLEQVMAENKTLKESAYEDVVKHFEARTQAAEALALKTEVRQKFLEANGCKDDESFDALWDIIKNKIQIQDNEVRIVAQNGTPKFTLTGSMMTLRDFIQSLKQDPISRKFFLS
ncbi:MAG: hypothetical protein RMY64_06555 [Nostoc sp. DedQUE08]|uniref:hypothetical protein n=1 Tax=unclassified Nostoc TaxID=2593658 RepID=UPI002AD4C618|nr:MULTISPECIES: hypothetical protein [unclassified Nostoc]MDZ8034452.1 hypothetical protein [Nostoc sp. DedSLP04]MDZ8065287.1 hypothetical protein [Nostoc sp. DedQUE08]MDZ8139506.1 hypothetical protein [Nostoc sp. DedQUE04]